MKSGNPSRVISTLTMGTQEHKNSAPTSVKIGIIAVSTTRALENDASGLWMRRQAIAEGHQVLFHRVVTDDSILIAQTIRQEIQNHLPQVLLLTGGTGISDRDVTIEAVQPMFSKELSAFGPLFAQLSFDQIKSAAILSRATAGIVGETVVFCMPGSLGACKLACKELIFPELGHLVRHILMG